MGFFSWKKHRNINGALCSGCGEEINSGQTQNRHTDQWICIGCKERLDLLGGYSCMHDGPLNPGELKKLPLVDLRLLASRHYFDKMKYPFRARVTQAAIELAKNAQK